MESEEEEEEVEGAGSVKAQLAWGLSWPIQVQVSFRHSRGRRWE